MPPRGPRSTIQIGRSGSASPGCSDGAENVASPCLPIVTATLGTVSFPVFLTAISSCVRSEICCSVGNDARVMSTL